MNVQKLREPRSQSSLSLLISFLFLSLITGAQSGAIPAREVYANKKQHHFGLRVIAFSLLFTAAMLLGLSLVADAGGRFTAVIAVVVLAAATIPMIAARRSKQQLMLEEKKVLTLEQPATTTTLTV
ncbi:hypothetical protein [Paraflavitalea pollutisoli]|uniref:hypothetical protein n=1 Tax=Paraflavitalea pollutisoli TaxID=3034143 RepID=UPI0023EDDF1B|nr:hypothetical protein [Paraflavitalea sp. H1-2-19X]